MSYLSKKYKKRMTRDEVCKECLISKEQYKEIFYKYKKESKTIPLLKVYKFLRSTQ